MPGLRFQPAGDMADSIGWAAALLLLATLGRQVYSQWRDRSAQGVSRWLFIGQFASSTGFIVYSVMLSNWVFVFTNAMILVVAAVGQRVTSANKRRAGKLAEPGR